MWFNDRVMSTISSRAPRETSQAATEVTRALVALVALIAIFGIVAFAPRLDPSKPVAGLACSVISENQAARALGTTVRLLPSTGTLCRYVSTTWNGQRSLYVVARSDDDPSLGSGTRRVGRSLYVRRDHRTYVVTVSAPDLDDAATYAVERNVAAAAVRTVVAARR